MEYGMDIDKDDIIENGDTYYIHSHRIMYSFYSALIRKLYNESRYISVLGMFAFFPVILIVILFAALVSRCSRRRIPKSLLYDMYHLMEPDINIVVITLEQAGEAVELEECDETREIPQTFEQLLTYFPPYGHERQKS